MQKITYLLLIFIICSCNSTENKEDTSNNGISKEEQSVNSKEPVDSEIVNIDTLIETELIKEKEPLPVKKSNPIPVKLKEPIVVKKVGSLHIEEPLFDFGRVIEGAIVIHEFEIENKGNATLHITDIEVDCGCTVPEYTKEGIAPGAKESIKVTFDTKGKLASQIRYITIYTDGKPLSKLVRLKGLVSTD